MKNKTIFGNFKNEVYFTIDRDAWNEIVRTHYDAPDYDFWDDEEGLEDNSYTFIAKKEELEEYDREELEKLPTGTSCMSTHRILADLCNKELIEPGNYLISL